MFSSDVRRAVEQCCVVVVVVAADVDLVVAILSHMCHSLPRKGTVIKKDTKLFTRSFLTRLFVSNHIEKSETHQKMSKHFACNSRIIVQGVKILTRPAYYRWVW